MILRRCSRHYSAVLSEVGGVAVVVGGGEVVVVVVVVDGLDRLRLERTDMLHHKPNVQIISRVGIEVRKRE